MKYVPEHPLASSTGLVSAARLALFERIGPGAHPCHWCGTRVEWRTGERGNRDGALLADHVDGNPLNDDPANLVSSCWTCNTERGKRKSRRVADDEIFITERNGTRLRGVERSCRHCGEPFVARASDVKRGKGEFCSLRCARSHH